MRKKILKILEDSRGRFISGEALAERFGVSRAAVWKAVSALKAEGHRVRAVTRRGYCLESYSDVLSSEGVLANLRDGSKIKKVIYLDKIDSTNNYAKKLALEGAPAGTLITANQQTAGRGRHGHSFVSPPGTGLYMTLILRPKVDTSQFQMITVAAAVAVCLAIEGLSDEFKPLIKWVNDIFLRGKKICGILTEAVSNFENGEIESVVTGIGINVSTQKFEEELLGSAGSIFPALPVSQNDEPFRFGRDELAARVADYVMDFSERLDDPFIVNAYRERSMLLNQDITYMKDNDSHRGNVIGIDDSGGLVLRNEDGGTETLRSGEVFMIRPCS